MITSGLPVRETGDRLRSALFGPWPADPWAADAAAHTPLERLHFYLARVVLGRLGPLSVAEPGRR